MDNNKRPESMQRITTPELARAFIDEQVEAGSWSPFMSIMVSFAKVSPNR